MGARTFANSVRLRLIRRDLTIRSSGIAPGATIGMHVWIMDGTYIGQSAAIGDYSYINGGARVFSGTLGRYCSIGYNSIIGPPTHPHNHPILSSRVGTSSFYPLSYEQFPNPPLIGDDVWIGANSVVLQGASIGSGAVIGAGAIVTRPVEAFQIVAGVPARTVGQRTLSEDVRRTILKGDIFRLNPDQLATAFGGAPNARDPHDDSL